MSIQVKIKKSFGTFALDVCFEAGDETVGLLGASGCGKSMTLKCIAGIVRPDEGKIVVNGRTLFDSERHIDLSPQKRRVGLLFQNYALFPNMTVEQNILSVLSRKERKGARKRLASLVERFYLTGLERRYPAQLSGGQQQRAAVARIMAADPSILMLDEPLSALDSYLRWQLEGEIMQILDDFRGTALCVSHNRDEVYRLCRKVCTMSQGRNEEVRTIGELFKSPNTLASSLLSGCKNYSRITRLDERRIRAMDWNVDLRCGADIAEDACYVGVRSHCVEPDTTETGGDGGENSFPCRVLRVIDDVFSTIINLCPLNAPSSRDFSRIRMELPKREAEAIRAGDVVRVKIKPHDLMLLKK
ncbi:MAG: ATP-binding cassette domain-containing protein [Synergistaceae bacterium]|jgi:molybdate transport system ATP-binding protein|nr:ATP-binding cassette domain-containing protein [Synergistaceae bacterium]